MSIKFYYSVHSRYAKHLLTVVALVLLNACGSTPYVQKRSPETVAHPALWHKLPIGQMQAGARRITVLQGKTRQERAVLNDKGGVIFSEGMGVLYVHDTPSKTCHYNRDNPMGVSVAYLDDNGRIVNIDDMAAFSEGNECSLQPVRRSLEMPYRWFSQNNLKAGDTIGAFTPISQDSAKTVIARWEERDRQLKKQVAATTSAKPATAPKPVQTTTKTAPVTKDATPGNLPALHIRLGSQHVKAWAATNKMFLNGTFPRTDYFSKGFRQNEGIFVSNPIPHKYCSAIKGLRTEVAFITEKGKISSIHSATDGQSVCAIEPILYSLTMEDKWFSRNNIYAGLQLHAQDWPKADARLKALQTAGTAISSIDGADIGRLMIMGWGLYNVNRILKGIERLSQ